MRKFFDPISNITETEVEEIRSGMEGHALGAAVNGLKQNLRLKFKKILTDGRLASLEEIDGSASYS